MMKRGKMAGRLCEMALLVARHDSKARLKLCRAEMMIPRVPFLTRRFWRLLSCGVGTQAASITARPGRIWRGQTAYGGSFIQVSSAADALQQGRMLLLFVRDGDSGAGGAGAGCLSRARERRWVNRGI